MDSPHFDPKVRGMSCLLPIGMNGFIYYSLICWLKISSPSLVQLSGAHLHLGLTLPA